MLGKKEEMFRKKEMFFLFSTSATKSIHNTHVYMWMFLAFYPILAFFFPCLSLFLFPKAKFTITYGTLNGGKFGESESTNAVQYKKECL